MKRQVLLPTLADQPFFCFPESVGTYWQELDHDVTREVGTLNNFNIHYVASGTGYVESEGRVYKLQKGDAVLYFPLQRQRYFSCTEDPWDVRWLHFYGSKINEYLIERGFHKSQLWTLRQGAAFEQAHLALLDKASAHKLLHKAALSVLTYAVLAEFISQAVPLTAARSSDATERVLGLLPLIQSEACKPFILEEWSARAGVSPYYFCKLFRKAVQMKPMDFVTLCRLQVSKQWLLERKTSTIREIAIDAGYPSVSYFNKRFYEHEGMTPSEYRKLYEKQS
ncbi:helix-turn-helix transcriptional regulator [Paenibacillus thalictri]|uniref:AraC family transcriptional regulator n=1 Tax=Paenibacillus thalictri TaxID=2527873 RepID=A0A4Q9DVK7_9BACL|nr:AraC family transcriptional regulator [Paenibacillus thalictri]TBL80314.1 AraC family transcriptional regulator [Paenibacillus thalictri]